MEPDQVQEEVIRKIKKFKINVRPFGVLRHLKKQTTIEPGKEPEDSELEAAIAQVQPHVVPCAVYRTFSLSETPEPLKTLLLQSPTKTLSLSIIAATIGRPIESELENVSQKNDAYQSALWNSIARESLEQSFNFVERLIGGEAETESCELSSLLPAGAELLEPILAALEAQKADINLNDSGQISPFFTGLRYGFWTPLKGRNAKK